MKKEISPAAQAKLKEIQTIQFAARMWKRGGGTPFSGHVTTALMVGSGFAVFAYAGLMGLDAFEVLPNMKVAILFCLALIPLLAGTYTALLSKSPRTHQAHIDQLLTAYEPVNEKNFRLLQSQVQEKKMTPEMIEDWAVAEIDTYKRNTGIGSGETYQFTSKEV